MDQLEVPSVKLDLFPEAYYIYTISVNSKEAKVCLIGKNTGVFFPADNLFLRNQPASQGIRGTAPRGAIQSLLPLLKEKIP